MHGPRRVNAGASAKSRFVGIPRDSWMRLANSRQPYNVPESSAPSTPVPPLDAVDRIKPSRSDSPGLSLKAPLWIKSLKAGWPIVATAISLEGSVLASPRTMAESMPTLFNASAMRAAPHSTRGAAFETRRTEMVPAVVVQQTSKPRRASQARNRLNAWLLLSLVGRKSFILQFLTPGSPRPRSA